MRELTKIAIRAVILAAAGAVLALAVNAVSPRGIPLKPMIFDYDYPPAKGAQPGPKHITLKVMQGASELAAMPLPGLPPSVVVDAREPREYREARIPGAINLPIEAFKEGRPTALKTIPKDADIIVYCDDPDCGAALTVAEQLRLHGYPPGKVNVFTGGFPAWQQAGLEVAHD